MKTVLLSVIMSISLGAFAQQNPMDSQQMGQMPQMMQMMQMMRECPMNVLMIPGTVKYEATPNGAQLTFTPNDPSQLEAFQKQVREFAERMNKGGTGMMMMQKMMEGMKNPESKSKEEPKAKEESGSDHSAHHPDKD
jgi:hypothetical protein